MKVCVFVVDDSKAWAPTDFGDMFAEAICGCGADCGCSKGSGCESCFQTSLWEFSKCHLAAGECMCDPLDFDAFIISGSRFNVRDGLVEGSQLSSWFNPLVALIQRLATENDETMAAKRMFGCCFGHQIIAHALGGEVGKNPGGEFILLAESLSFDHQAIKHAPCCCDKSLGAILERQEKEESVKVINSHGDSVISIPAKSWRLASSKSCANEVVQWAPNIMSCQGHPEFNMKYAIEERIWPAVVEKNKRLSEEAIQVAKESFAGFSRESGPDLLALFMTEFIRGGKRQ